MRKALFLSLLIASTFLLLGLLGVSAPDILDTPIDKKITVTSNETFVLSFKMKFNETEGGYFVTTFYWDNNEIDPRGKYWNFTYEGFVAKFTDGTEFSVPIDVSIKKEIPSGYPSGYYRYTVRIFAINETRNGNFWVNATMRAAGVMNGTYIPHIGQDQNITIVSARSYETETVEVGPGDCTIHVTPKIFSSDSTGGPKEVFNITLGEAVYVKGYGFNSSVGIRLYVVQNTTWTEGQTWIDGDDVRGTFNLTSADSNGNLAAYRLGILPLGEYDIVADVYPYNRYSNSTDAVDNLSSAPGVTVVPEFPNGMAIIMAISAVASLLIYVKKRKLSAFI